MPYKAEKLLLPKLPGHDRRFKLHPIQRDLIRKNPCGFSTHRLAKMFGVSRRLITFIQHPERLIENKAKKQERGGWKQYYSPEYHATKMKEMRRYKHEYFQENGDDTNNPV